MKTLLSSLLTVCSSSQNPEIKKLFNSIICSDRPKYESSNSRNFHSNTQEIPH